MTFFLAHLSQFSVMIFLLGLSAFFSGSETALFSLSKVDLRKFLSGRGSIPRAVSFFAKEPSEFLSTVLFCNMLVNILFYSMAAGISLEAAEALAGTGAWHSTAVLLISLGNLLLVIIFGEVTPKSLAVLAPRAFLKLSGIPMAGLHWVFTPVRSGLRQVTAVMDRICRPRGKREQQVEELNLMLEALAQEGELSRNESLLVSEVMDFPEIRLREFMTPRVAIQMAPQDSVVEDLIALAQTTGHYVFPLFGEHHDDITGVVDVRELLLGRIHGPAKAFAARVLFFSEYQRADDALRQLNEQDREFGIVVDEYGGTAGLVTLSGILRQIFIDEGDDKVQAVRKLGPGHFALSGSLSLRDFFELIPDSEDLPRVDVTVAGLMNTLLGHIPEAGEFITRGRIRFTIDQVVRHHAESVLLEVLAEPHREPVPNFRGVQ